MGKLKRVEAHLRATLPRISWTPGTKGLNKIKEAGFYSIMAGEVTSFNNEISSQCFRFVDKNKQIWEEFVEFIHVERINSEFLLKAIIDFCNKEGIDRSEFCGQCFDGATNLSLAKKMSLG